MRIHARNTFFRFVVLNTFLVMTVCLCNSALAGEFEESEEARSVDVQLRFSDRTNEAITRENWQGLRDVQLEQARAHANARQPIAQAEALETAALGAGQLKRADEAESLLRQAISILDSLNPSNRLDREKLDYLSIKMRLNLAGRVVANPQRQQDAQTLVDSVRSLCNGVQGRFAQRACNPRDELGYQYAGVLAKLGNSAAQTQVQEWKKVEEAALAALRPYAERFAASRNQSDHAGVIRSGAELRTQLIGRQHIGGGFLGPLVDFDRAEAFRLQGDAISSEATLREARRQLTSSFNLEKMWLDSEAETAAKLGLTSYATQLRREGLIVARLDSLQGLDKRQESLDERPAKLLESRTQLARTADQLQSLGATFSAEFALQRLRDVSAAYQKRIAEVAAERASAERVRAEDEARDRASWEFLRNAIAYAGGSRPQRLTTGALPQVSTSAGSNPATLGSSSTACSGSKEACAVQACQQNGGASQITSNALGCRWVNCSFRDSRNNYANLIASPSGSGCAGYVK